MPRPQLKFAELAEVRAEVERSVHGKIDEALGSLLDRIEEATRPLRFNRPSLIEEDAADYLGVSVDKVKKLRRAGCIDECLRDGHSVYYSRESLDAYLRGERGSLSA